MTQARIALLTPFSPIGWTSQVSLEQSYRQIPEDVRLRWDNETQRKAWEAYNLQRYQEREAEIAQQAAEEAERNNHSTAWIIWDEVGTFAEGGVSLFVDLVEGKPEVLKERANEVADGMAGLVGMAVHPVQTYHQISESSSGQKTRMMTELVLGFLPLKTKVPKLPFDMPRPNPGMEVVGADGMVYRIAEKDLPGPEKNGYMRSEGTGQGVGIGSRSVEESLEKINEIRQANNIGGKRNIAFAEYEINGSTGEIIGVSGKADRAGTAGVPNQRKFETITTPDGNPRTLDAEVKILEELASQLPTNVTGKVHLFSELPFCQSCSGVIKQFKEQFPNVEVIISHGPSKSR
ncbi:deaminase domain-containing protein [Paenibacillus sp. Z6-24]